MKNQKWFEKFSEAKKEAKKRRLPVWDTHTPKNRYMVGYPTIEQEEDPANEDWELVS